MLKRLWWMVLCGVCLPAAHAQEAQLHFQSPEEARTELTTGAGLQYFAALQLGEMRAKTGLPLQNLTLDAARVQAREAYGSAVRSFTAEEQAALRAAVAHLQPLLLARAPLYARTPWSFIKVSDNIEGGMPHTRGDSIVLATAVVTALAQAHAKGGLERPSGFWNLLVHEQTHVLQRRQGALFTDLYTGPFAFRQVRVAALPDWLAVRRVINPDAPEVDWAFAVGAADARQWFLPDILLATLDHPKMPQDFQVVALPITLSGDSASYVDRSLPAHPRELETLEGFGARFPLHDELFHPNEIAAGLLAAIISGVGTRDPDHPLWAQTRQWAAQALR